MAQIFFLAYIDLDILNCTHDYIFIHAKIYYQELRLFY